MSILIKGMEMPTSCADCKWRMAVGCCGNLPHNIRMPNCPLIELPPHGRLIDADALKIEDWWLVDIKDLIRKRGMRQAEVARAIGIRPQYLHAIIVGERPLSIRYVVPLCKCLGITPNVLFGYERMFVPTDSDHASVKDWLASDPTIIESEE